MKFRYIAVALAAAAATSCAKRPDAIVPADIPMAAYTGQTCPALQTELAKEKAALSAVSKQQHDAANGDAFGVFLIGVPMSSTFGGDKECASHKSGRVIAETGTVLRWINRTLTSLSRLARSSSPITAFQHLADSVSG